MSWKHGKIYENPLGMKKLWLGFYDMGEDVAYKWSVEEEEIFHEVVYTNPASLGKKFWKHLSVVLPSRSKRELVSYYFIVFILQRRAVQNRSSVLEIDSDDDEWHGNQQAYEAKPSEKDDSSAIESLADQEGLANHEGDCLEYDDDNGSDDDNDYNSDSCDGNYSNAAEREDYGVNFLLKGHVSKSFAEGRFNAVFEQTNKVSEQAEDFDVQDDSCMLLSFCQTWSTHSLIDTKTDLHDSEMKTDLSKRMEAKVDGSNDLVNHVYLFDTRDTKIWDTRYPTAVTKCIDLQPTCNIIEEIFWTRLQG